LAWRINYLLYFTAVDRWQVSETCNQKWRGLIVESKNNFPTSISVYKKSSMHH
jgi:hypothetical protein